jgi:hypothetical protein
VDILNGYLIVKDLLIVEIFVAELDFGKIPPVHFVEEFVLDECELIIWKLKNRI